MSCIRLSARMKVDLPQPLGPMIAVTLRAAIRIVMSSRARRCPYHMLKLRMSKAISAAAGSEAVGAGEGAADIRIGSAAEVARAVSGGVAMVIKARLFGRAIVRGP